MALILTTRHLFTIPYFSKRPGFCRAKAREWADRHGIDWHDAVRNGIDADLLLATGDGFAEALVAWARECEAAAQAKEGPANG